MMHARTYNGPAIALHWLGALLILSAFLLGLYMTGLELSPTKLKLYSYHKWLGVTVLVLVAGYAWAGGWPAVCRPHR